MRPGRARAEYGAGPGAESLGPGSRGPTAEEQDGRMRILLADDAALLREGLAGLLAAAGHEVVAQVADADALRTEVARLAAAGELPDVVVTDVRMPPTRTDDGSLDRKSVV